ncbi:DUF6482 family protein [Marinobacter sp. C2H3]|uniref:DUF6482 family protein n=1 Tax=Marinobacter sp. C2H3 TaxID=3119003 RepID=UPI00300F5768
MRITFEQLRNTRDLVIDLLEILSLEGQRYMARLVIGEQTLLLSGRDGTTRLFRSAWEVQDALAAFTVKETQVVHPSAYHEMVGMAPADIEPLRIRVQRQSS